MDQAQETAKVPTGEPEKQEAAPARPPQPYDFRRPQHLFAEQMRAVHRLHASAAEALQNRLGRCLGVPLTVELKGVEQISFGLLAQGVTQPAYVNLLDLSPLQEKGLLLLDGGLCLGFVDRILGGTGKAEQPLRPLTEVDQVALERPIEVILECLRGAWQDLCRMELSVASRCSDLLQARVFAPGEGVLSVHLEVSAEFGRGPLRLCLPMAPLKAALEGMAHRVGIRPTTPERIASLRRAVQASLERVSLPVAASVGSAELSVRHFLGLKPGDVVRLDQPADRPVLLHVSGRPLFACKMGLRGRRKAVQVLERIDTSLEE